MSNIIRIKAKKLTKKKAEISDFMFNIIINWASKYGYE